MRTIKRKGGPALRVVVQQLKECTHSTSVVSAFRIFSADTTGVLYDASLRLKCSASPNLHECGLESFDIAHVFKMGEILGKGSAGVVQEASFKCCTGMLSCSKHVAIKILLKRSPWWLNNVTRRRETTLREVSILQRISATNITGVARVYAAIETPDNICIVMELCTGGDLLQTVLGARAPISEENTAHVIRSLATTVAELHKAGIIHRDIKPENVIYSNTSEHASVKLVDFGLSNTMSEGINMTSFVGTGAFMAPEVLTVSSLTSKREYDEKVDSWGLGIVMYIMLSNSMPWPSNLDKEQLADLIEKRGVRFPEARGWGAVSTEAKTLLRRLMSANSAARPSAAQLAHSDWVQSFNDNLAEQCAVSSVLAYPSLTARIMNKFTSCLPRAKDEDSGHMPEFTAPPRLLIGSQKMAENNKKQGQHALNTTDKNVSQESAIDEADHYFCASSTESSASSYMYDESADSFMASEDGGRVTKTRSKLRPLAKFHCPIRAGSSGGPHTSSNDGDYVE